jgi:hypothetical protein
MWIPIHPSKIPINPYKSLPIPINPYRSLSSSHEEKYCKIPCSQHQTGSLAEPCIAPTLVMQRSPQLIFQGLYEGFHRVPQMDGFFAIENTMKGDDLWVPHKSGNHHIFEASMWLHLGESVVSTLDKMTKRIHRTLRQVEDILPPILIEVAILEAFR